MTRVVGPLPKQQYEDTNAIREALYKDVVPASEREGIFADQHGHYLGFLDISQYSKEKAEGELFNVDKIQKLLVVIEQYLVPSALNIDRMSCDFLSQNVIKMGYPKREETPSYRDIAGAMLLSGFTLYLDHKDGSSHLNFNARIIPV